METIRNYLEAMFRSLPNTPQVQRAKNELGAMMEDKYNELKAEGRSENEAVGIVISEFGNLDELAQDLGLDDYAQEELRERCVTLSEAADYIRMKSKAGFFIGVGVLLCILSPCGVILAEDGMAGIVFLFCAIAAAVGMFVFSGIVMEQWDFLEKEPCYIDYGTAQYVQNESDNFRIIKALFITIGVILCIVSVVPLVVLDELRGGLWTQLGVDIMLVLVAVAVLLFIMAGTRAGAYHKLLGLNSQETVGGHFVSGQQEQVRYSNPTVAAVMSVYWQTVTCIYLSWSFLSGDWHITWVIWVLAWLVESVVRTLDQK